MLLTPRFLCRTLTGAGCAVAILPLHAATLLVAYDLDTGTAAFEPFDIPNPQGGADLTITPSLSIERGSFEAAFETESGAVALNSGDASIRNLTFEGSISISIATIVSSGPFELPVEAVLSGPLNGAQIQSSNGTYSILGGDTVYTDTEPGLFDVTAGPLECRDSFLGILCALLETGLGITFPIEIPAADDAPLPFAASFQDLDMPGASTSGNTLDFSVPISDAGSFGASIEFTWIESGRVLVPEPPILVMAPLALLALARRSRPDRHQ